MVYNEDDMLMLSGIQHFAYCPRQWALIHIAQEWNDNRLTVEGQILHTHVDDPFYRNKVGEVICWRSLNIASRELGLYGIADVVELHPAQDDTNAIEIAGSPGWWQFLPVEYKHGKPKADNIDAVQLCAQAMCLEEQYNVVVNNGALYYGETRRREDVAFDKGLRMEVKSLAEAMHLTFKAGIIPLVEKTAKCRNCSLKGLCMPSLKSARAYLKAELYEETT